MLRRETVGPPDCPIFYRWTLFRLRRHGLKVLLHHFLPNSDDRDVHDHPWPFVTVVLKGSYDNIEPDEHGGLRVAETMRPGTVRYRAATHTHRTKTGLRGCWTLVFVGPAVRQWGFWRQGLWWSWQDYEAEFGFAMRCEDIDKEYRK